MGGPALPVNAAAVPSAKPKDARLSDIGLERSKLNIYPAIK
jgi:hypothetical protein